MKKVLTCILMFFMLCCLSAQNRAKRDWQDVAHDIFALHSEGKATDEGVMVLGITPLEANLVIYYLALIKATDDMNARLKSADFLLTDFDIKNLNDKVSQLSACLAEFTYQEIDNSVYYRNFFAEVEEYISDCHRLVSMLYLYKGIQR